MQQRSPAFFALIIVGVLLVVVGLIYGLSSRQTSYKSVPQAAIAHYLSSDGTGYLQMEGNSALYVVHEDNFTPKINSFADGDTISFVYDPGSTTAVDVSSTLGTHLTGTAAKVVEITAIGTSSQTLYKTPEFVANSQGYSHNQWGVGIAVIIVGLLLAIGSFFVPRKKTPAMVTPAPFAGVAMNGQEPQQYSAYPQQGATQYPQQQYPPAQPNYQPQTGAFQQTPFTGNPQSNQYGQPQPSPSWQQQGSPPYGQPQQPNPYEQPQQPGSFGQPQTPTQQGQFQQIKPFGQPNQQEQYPNPYGQPPQQ